MLTTVFEFLSNEGFSPHGLCLLWQPEVLWAHVISDLAIALAYFSIPVALFVYSAKRGPVRYAWVIWLFAAFIIACGLTHLMGIWTMWVPDYGLQAIVKVICALVSVATAIALWPLLPKALKLPTVDELEQQVSERTHSLQQANLALEDALARAQAASDAKTRFLSVMSHELRTPLNTIVGFADLMGLSQSQAETLDFSSEIRKAGLHLTDIISEILDFSRIESGHIKLNFEAIDPVSLLETIAEAMKPAADAAGVSICVEQDTGLPRVYADPVRLKQSLLNVVSNAIKYNKENGDIIMSAQNHEHTVTFRISDSGVGMSAADVDAAFTPFQRLGQENTNTQGSGLGLAITRRFIKAMGGEISLHPILGQGTVCEIQLMVAPQSLKENTVPGERSAPDDVGAAPAEKAKILAVEDNPVSMKLLTNILRYMDEDIEVFKAATLEEARALFKREQPDLLLLDLNLPDGNGMQLLDDMDADQRRVPTIIITADATENTRSQCQKFDFARFFSKPYLVEDMMGAIRQSIVQAA